MSRTRVPRNTKVPRNQEVSLRGAAIYLTIGTKTATRRANLKNHLISSLRNSYQSNIIFRYLFITKYKE